MKRPRVRHEIRSFAGAELYGRLLREAAARGLTVSECVRRELEELYAFRDELGDALRIASDDGTPARGLFDAALNGLEARLAGNFGAQLERLERANRNLARLEAMIDRFYLGVMLHLEDVPEQLRPVRLKRASERHRAWLDVVKRVAPAPSGASSAGVAAGTQEASDASARLGTEHPPSGSR
jgi:hypothetical protein